MLKSIHTAARPITNTPRTSVIARLFHRLVDADRRYREVLDLRNSSEDRLRDIGVTRAEIERMIQNTYR